MKHFNGNFPCVIDTETTGFDPRKFDIVSMCCLPLDPDNLEINRDVPLIELSIAPARPENVDFDAIRIQRQNNEYGQADDICFVKERLTYYMTKGLDSQFAAKLFVEWFEKLKLKPGKKIIPIAQNWPFDREHLIEWLGYKTFDYMFCPYYRDTMCMSLMDNDIAAWHDNPYPYQHNHLGAICSANNIKRDRKHTALDDCVDTAAAFKRMIQRMIPVRAKEVEREVFDNPTYTVPYRPDSKVVDKETYQELTNPALGEPH